MAYVSTSLCSDLSVGCERAEGQKVTERWYEWRKIIRENLYGVLIFVEGSISEAE